MNKAPFHILRVGMAITFLWIGVLILKNPESFGGYLQPWAFKLLPVSASQALLATAFLDMIIGVLFLIDWQTWLAGLLASLHLVIVLMVSGITDITVRDIGLLAASVAVVIESLPIWVKNKII